MRRLVVLLVLSLVMAVPVMAAGGDGGGDWLVVDGGQYRPRDVRTGELCCEYYLYFLTDSTGTATDLRLLACYCADDPLRYRGITFIIGGEEYLFTPCEPRLERKGRRYYIETSDTPLHEGDTPLLDALLATDGVTLRLQGAGGMSHVMRLEPRQRDNLRRIIALYRRMGGTL